MQIKKKGFSLLELLISIAIIAVLTSIAYPAYTYYLVKMHRRRAQVALMQVAGRLEQFYSLEGQYREATPTILGLQKIEKGLKYKLKISQQDFDHFTVSAVPLTSQAKRDAKCGTLSITETGEKRISGYGQVNNCW